MDSPDFPTERFAEDIAASQTDAELAPAPGAGKKIIVTAVAFVCGDTATTAVLNSASDAISQIFQNGANGGAVIGYHPKGWYACAENEPLTVTTGAGSTTGINGTYMIVPSTFKP